MLKRILVPRCVKWSPAKYTYFQMQAVGYGSMAYPCPGNNQDHIHRCFLMGKARLEPIKAVTIPRLELTATTVSIRLGETLKKELD